MNCLPGWTPKYLNVTIFIKGLWKCQKISQEEALLGRGALKPTWLYVLFEERTLRGRHSHRTDWNYTAARQFLGLVEAKKGLSGVLISSSWFPGPERICFCCAEVAQSQVLLWWKPQSPISDKCLGWATLSQHLISTPGAHKLNSISSCSRFLALPHTGLFAWRANPVNLVGVEKSLLSSQTQAMITSPGTLLWSPRQSVWMCLPLVTSV